MPRKPISFELDFMVKDIFPRFTVKQFDDVSFNIKPKNQGLDYDTTGMIGKIFVGVNNDMFMQTTGITVSSDNINVLLDKNMLQKNGRAYAEIELTDDAGTITSSSFIFDIDPKIGEGGQIPGEYEGFVEKYERLISEFKSQVNSCTNNANNLINKTINDCNSSVNNKLNTVDGLINSKISDFEKRFNRLTSSQQQSAEIIDARVDFKGQNFSNLKERIDYTDKILRDSTVSTVETESSFTTVDATSNGYFEDVKLEGKTLTTVFTCSTNKQYAKWTEVDCVNYKTVEIGKVYTVIGELNNSVKCGLKNETQDYLLALDSSNGSYICKAITFSKTDKLKIVTDVEGSVNMKVIILEGDHTNNPPSYFEGLLSVGQDVEEVSVESCFNVADIAIDGDTNFEVAHIKKGIPYSISVKRSANIGYNLVLRRNGKETILVGNSFSDFNTFTSNEDGVLFYNSYDKVAVSEIMLLPVLYSKDTMPKYKPYSPNKKPLLYYNPTTEIWEKPVLREWDTIEKHSDGKYYYHKRSGEVVLNGSESWHFPLNQIGNNTVLFYSNITDAKTNQTYPICNIFTGTYLNIWEPINDIEGIFINHNKDVIIRINKAKLSTQDEAGFRAWLKANPTTVVYRLIQEEVYECTNIDLMTYSGETNYIVNTGAITPKSTLKVHSNISNVVKILQEKVSLLESNVKTSQKIQDMMILESDIRILNMELALMEHMPVKLNLGENSMLRSLTYFNFLKNHIINETYSKDYLKSVISKYLVTNRLTKDEYDELYKMLYPQNSNIELPIEH